MKTKWIGILFVIIIGIYVGLNGKQDTDYTAKSTSTNQQPSPFPYGTKQIIETLPHFDFQTTQLETLVEHWGRYKQDNVNYSMIIYEKSEEIEWIELEVDASYYLNLDTPEHVDPKLMEQVHKITKQHFKYPFLQGNNQEAFKKWIDKNVATSLGVGKGVTEQFGNFEFHLYGQPLVRWLEVTPKEAD